MIGDIKWVVKTINGSEVFDDFLEAYKYHRCKIESTIYPIG